MRTKQEARVSSANNISPYSEAISSQAAAGAHTVSLWLRLTEIQSGLFYRLARLWERNPTLHCASGYSI